MPDKTHPSEIELLDYFAAMTVQGMYAASCSEFPFEPSNQDEDFTEITTPRGEDDEAFWIKHEGEWSCRLSAYTKRKATKRYQRTGTREARIARDAYAQAASLLAVRSKNQ